MKGGNVTGLNSPQPPTHWVGSKTVPGFESLTDAKARDEAAAKVPVPGLARVLFVGLFLGEDDWNLDNWGYGPGKNGIEIRRIDMTGFDFNEGNAVENLLTPQGLLAATRTSRRSAPVSDTRISWRGCSSASSRCARWPA